MSADAAQFVRARSVQEALGSLQRFASGGPRPVLLAGGTDWMVERQLGHHAPEGPAPSVIDVSGISALQTIERKALTHGIEYTIGGGATYLQMRRHESLVREVPMIDAMAREVGAIQIQARGTLAGNLATGSPAADGVPVLFALAAIVRVQSEARGTRDIAVDQFYTGYKKHQMAADEMIVDIRLRVPTGPWFWRKVGTRRAQSISKVALAATAQLDQGRIDDVHFGMASVAPTIAALPSVRAALRGGVAKSITPETWRGALTKDIAPIDDVRSTREYRLHVAERLVQRFLESIQ